VEARPSVARCKQGGLCNVNRFAPAAWMFLAGRLGKGCQRSAEGLLVVWLTAAGRGRRKTAGSAEGRDSGKEGREAERDAGLRQRHRAFTRQRV